MGEDWDIYCAICGVLTHDEISDDHVGTRNPSMLAFRRAEVAAEKKRAKEGDGLPRGFFDEENWDGLDESTIDWDWDDEAASYDPDLVEDLGCAFITGDAATQEYGTVVFVDGLHPDQDLDEEVRHWNWQERQSYWTMLEGKSVFFPTHACCRRILEAVLHPPSQNAEAAPTLNLKALYEAMCLLSEMFTAQLTVKYGEFEGNYVVARPEFSDASSKSIHDKIMTGAFEVGKPFTLPDMNNRQMTDRFASLSNELLVKIAEHLPISDVLACSKASWAMMNASSANSFWKDALNRDMSWAKSALEPVLATVKEQDLDYKRLLLWLEEATRPEFAMEWPWLQAGNRRRIWGVCEQIGQVYWRRLGRKSKVPL
ncbi:F-box domain-containing protein [Pochonia chlamydosporia 170]|uniref:F-box domain-containing protein n=1 Tax=Pochonia chlamydosporia 170 TaxID=1380566 RepID=A0A179FBS0_METCM|nr:F-box domain-containing protein [Pochonia chlamydosporia 170]OAQ62868.2 F-box domain-containing protein [Pochonia chlamydosporia 170]